MVKHSGRCGLEIRSVLEGLRCPGRQGAFACPAVNRVCMTLLYGRAGNGAKTAVSGPGSRRDRRGRAAAGRAGERGAKLTVNL